MSGLQPSELFGKPQRAEEIKRMILNTLDGYGQRLKRVWHDRASLPHPAETMIAT
jgi:hypothetical protein